MPQAAGAIFCMPSPAVVTASAEWIVTSNWARAAELRLGSAFLEVAGKSVGTEAARSKGTTRRSAPPRLVKLTGEPRLVWARTALADARRVRRNLIDSRRPLPCAVFGRPAFVWEYHSPFFRRGRVFSARYGCPVVRFVAAPQVWEARRWGVDRGAWGRLLERLGEVPALRAADLVCCVSEQVRHAVLDIARLVPERVIVTPNTSPAAAMVAPRSAAQRLRSEWGVQPSTLLVGWTGSFRAFHDLGFLLDAVERVEGRATEWSVVLIGEGSMRSSVEEAARARSLPVRCVGALPHAAMPVALAAFDLAVLPLRSAERFHYSPIKLREYSAAGLPIVAPDTEDSRHLLGRDAALFYAPGDVEGLAERMSRIIVNPGLRETLSYAVSLRHTETGETGREVDLVLNALHLSSRQQGSYEEGKSSG